MAQRSLIMYDDDAVTAPGAVRGWKVAFGYAGKGTVVVVYRVGQPPLVTEIPVQQGNGKTDVSAVSAWLQTNGGVTLPQAARTLIGA